MLRKILSSLIVMSIVVGCVPEGTLSHTSKGTQKVFGDWNVYCNSQDIKNNNCLMEQSLIVGKQFIANVLFVKLKAGSEAVAGIDVVLPQGVLLTSGVTMKVPGQPPRKYQINLCGSLGGSPGCLARFGITQKELEAYKTAGSVTVTIRSGNEPTKDISMKLSMRGFSEAYAKLVPTKSP